MLYQGIIGGGSSPVEPVDLSPVLLWTNPDTNEEFSGQTVSLDLTDYVGVIIEYNHAHGNNTFGTRIYAKKTDNYASAGAGFSGDMAYARNILSVTNTGVEFSNALAGSSQANYSVIPMKIYGVKEYVVEPFKPIDATVCERAYTFPATSGKTNTWTVVEDGLYFLTGDAPGISDSRGSISLIGDITLISGSEPVRVFKAKAGAQVALIVSSGNTFTPYINRIK